jgi:hypothetical protein
MEKKSSRRDNSERKGNDNSEGKEGVDNREGIVEGSQAAAPKNRRKRAGDDGGWMTTNTEGTGSRHAVATIPVEEDEPKDAPANRYFICFCFMQLTTCVIF